jgi:cyclophilin family peptidyl-prolyl cis-trans isomerase
MRFSPCAALALFLPLGIGSAGPTVTGKTPVAETAVMETSLGTIEIELFRAEAPRTVDNFVKLAKKKFFDGLRFHRVAKGFVIQTGDHFSRDLKAVAKWGTGGKSIYGKEFADELNPSAQSYRRGYVRGVLAMANRGPNTNTSQFFIMLADAPQMPKNYTIFGRVVRGMEVVDKIGAVELDPPYATDGRPAKEVLLKSVRIGKPASAKPR